jgi:hypothetical protein
LAAIAIYLCSSSPASYLEAGNAFKAKHKSLDLKCGNLSTADLFIIVSKLTPRAEKILEKMESNL